METLYIIEGDNYIDKDNNEILCNTELQMFFKVKLFGKYKLLIQ